MRKTYQVDFSSAERQVMEFLLERTVTAIIETENDLREELNTGRGWEKRLRMASMRVPLERILYLQFEVLSGMLGKPAPDGGYPNIHNSYTEGDDLLPIWLDLLNIEDRAAGKYEEFDRRVEDLVNLFRM